MKFLNNVDWNERVYNEDRNQDSKIALQDKVKQINDK